MRKVRLEMIHGAGFDLAGRRLMTHLLLGGADGTPKLEGRGLGVVMKYGHYGGNNTNATYRRRHYSSLQSSTLTRLMSWKAKPDLELLLQLLLDDEDPGG